MKESPPMTTPPVIDVRHLAHRYGRKIIYDDLNFSLPPGKIYALLGKNGVGKTTLIQILMGFMRPVSGRCQVLGEDSHALSSATRARIGLLFEGHLAYEFMSIDQIEKFYAPFYPRWNRDLYYHLVDKLKLPHTHLIKNMSCGQRSQVVLGLIMAQSPDLLLLDDYSIGLDAGYRRLFLDDMREYLRQEKRTVFLTSHVIQDMVDFVDEVIFLERGGLLHRTCLTAFKDNFHCFRIKPPDTRACKATLEGPEPVLTHAGVPVIKNIEVHAEFVDLFSFFPEEEICRALAARNVSHTGVKEIPMTLEDAFIGYTGRY